MGTKLTIFTKFPFHVGFFCTNISEGIGDWLHMARLDNQYKTWNKYLGWHIRSVQQLKEIFHFSEKYADREDTGVEQMMHILCTHQRFSSKTRSCGEILEGNGEKYYKEMQRNIWRKWREILQGAAEKYL